MNSSMKKRFWDEATVQTSERGFGVALDDKPLKTPAKQPLLLPSFGLAKAIASEWQALEKEIDPTQLPFTKLCNAAIDNMEEKSAAVVEMLTAYSQTDLLCYRAESPDGLVQRQSDGWDPLLSWIRETHGIFFVQTAGILPVDQPNATVTAFREWLSGWDNFGLMAIHDLVMLSGSIVIPRAVIEGEISANDGWERSLIDEMWQVEQWGEDDEANALRSGKMQGFHTAAQLISLLGDVQKDK